MSHETNNVCVHAPDERPPARTWRDRGASLVEYALLLALIAVVCIGALQLLGTSLDDSIEDDATQLSNA
ncbi:MAG: Flp family type IVb pilin [Acidimicrobiales bacterium]